MVLGIMIRKKEKNPEYLMYSVTFARNQIEKE